MLRVALKLLLAARNATNGLSERSCKNVPPRTMNKLRRSRLGGMINDESYNQD